MSVLKDYWQENDHSTRDKIVILRSFIYGSGQCSSITSKCDHLRHFYSNQLLDAHYPHLMNIRHALQNLFDAILLQRAHAFA